MCVVICVMPGCFISVLIKEETEGSVNEDADEMPDVQETVAVIPGSTLLWRISPRPPHSAEVHTHINSWHKLIPQNSDFS